MRSPSSNTRVLLHAHITHRYATRRTDNQPYAIKIINKALCAGKEDMIEMELEVLRQVIPSLIFPTAMALISHDGEHRFR